MNALGNIRYANPPKFFGGGDFAVSHLADNQQLIAKALRILRSLRALGTLMSLTLFSRGIPLRNVLLLPYGQCSKASEKTISNPK